MKPFFEDADVTLHQGDCLKVLRALPDKSVDMCVTSPPYFGLRDYQTGSWAGGDSDCDHAKWAAWADPKKKSASETYSQYRDVCGKCGATRVDKQLGLESSVEEYVQNLVLVFREVRRVLADHGTLWLNIGDSYAGSGKGGNPEGSEWSGFVGNKKREESAQASQALVPDGFKRKDLMMVPARVALALQADGWWLRSDIIWVKNAMPESVTDRPSNTYEHVFMLSKSVTYYFDQEAVKEPAVSGNDLGVLRSKKAMDGEGPTDRLSIEKRLDAGVQSRNGNPSAMRNTRNVWNISTANNPDAHFATFPEELPRRCILAGCPEQVCGTCGKPSERLTERVATGYDGSRYGERAVEATGGAQTGGTAASTLGSSNGKLTASQDTVGWSDCGHGDYKPGVVLDPFGGSGTTAKVARDLNRHSVLIELSSEYVGLIRTRLQQLSLFF